MKKIYIAGKVSDEDFKEVAQKFAAAQSEIEKLGFIPINPVQLVQDYLYHNYPFFRPSEEEIWKIAMQVCIKELVDCDAVVLLPCWEQSKGAKIERQLADDLDILIVNFTKFGLEVMANNLR